MSRWASAQTWGQYCWNGFSANKKIVGLWKNVIIAWENRLSFSHTGVVVVYFGVNVFAGDVQFSSTGVGLINSRYVFLVNVVGHVVSEFWPPRHHHLAPATQLHHPALPPSSWFTHHHFHTVLSPANPYSPMSQSLPPCHPITPATQPAPATQLAPATQPTVNLVTCQQTTN